MTTFTYFGSVGHNMLMETVFMLNYSKSMEPNPNSRTQRARVGVGMSAEPSHTEEKREAEETGQTEERRATTQQGSQGNRAEQSAL